MDAITNTIEAIDEINKRLGDKLLEVQNTIKEIEENEERFYQISKNFFSFCQTILSSLSEEEKRRR